MQKGGDLIAKGSFGGVYSFNNFIDDLLDVLHEKGGRSVTKEQLRFQICFSNPPCGETTYIIETFANYYNYYTHFVYKVIFDSKERDAELESLQRVIAALRLNLNNPLDVKFVKDCTILALVEYEPPAIMTKIVISSPPPHGELVSLIPYARCDGNLGDAVYITFPEIFNIVDNVRRFLYQIKKLHHFDIKPANILYKAKDGKRNFILGDYGSISNERNISTPLTTCPFGPLGSIIRSKEDYLKNTDEFSNRTFFESVYTGYETYYNDGQWSDHEFYTKMDIYSLGITLYMLVNEHRVMPDAVGAVLEIVGEFIDPTRCFSLDDVVAFMKKYKKQGGGHKKKKVKLIDGRTRVVCLDHKKHKYIKVDNKKCYLKDIRGKYEYV